MIRGAARLALVATVVSVAVSGYLVLSPRLPASFGGRTAQVERAIEGLPVDEAVLARVAGIEPHLERLRRPGTERADGIDIALLGYREIKPPPVPEPVPEPAPVVIAPPPAEPEPFEYRVSMTYVSDGSRFAVIDGRFYREGATLRDGERLLAIEPNAVRIERHDMTRWVEIRRSPDTIGERDVIEATPTGFGSGIDTRLNDSLMQQVRHDG